MSILASTCPRCRDEVTRVIAVYALGAGIAGIAAGRKPLPLPWAQILTDEHIRQFAEIHRKHHQA